MKTKHLSWLIAFLLISVAYYVFLQRMTYSKLYQMKAVGKLKEYTLYGRQAGSL